MTEQNKTAQKTAGAKSADREIEPKPAAELALAGDPSRRARILESVTWPARRAGWAVEKVVLWPAADLMRRLADIVTWPFERVIWAFRSRVAWPLQDRFSERGRPVRTAIAVSAVGLAVAAAGAGAISGSPNGSAAPGASPIVASAEPIELPDSAERALFSSAGTEEEVAETSDNPVLLGVAPNFEVAGAVSNAGSGDAVNAGAGGTPINSDAGPGAAPSPAGSDETFTATKADIPKPDTVRPALNVSRQFADAFVLYEIGEGDDGVRTTFQKTAAKPLVAALKERPPRLPKGVKVPQAKVLNVVPGPRKGKSLSVSVALVRLGASSELRLRLKHDKETGWLVSDVRG